MSTDHFDDSVDIETVECSPITLNRWLRRVYDASASHVMQPRIQDRCRKVIEILEPGGSDILDVRELEGDDTRWCEFVEELVKLENCFLASTILLALPRDEKTREWVFLFGLGNLIQLAILRRDAAYDS